MKEWQKECFEHFSNKFRYIYTTDKRFYDDNVSYEKHKSRIKM